MTSFSRRDVMQGTCWAGVAAALMPQMAFAQMPTDQRIVFVNLRGAMDGLHAVVPYGDPAYANLRGDYAYAASDLTRLDSTFGLCPGLSGLKSSYDAGEFLPIHAVGIPVLNRSHFTAQVILEGGLSDTGRPDSGWLSRTLRHVVGTNSAGLAIASRVPLSLEGDQVVSNWLPGNAPTAEGIFKQSMDTLYLCDPILANPYTAALTFEEQAQLVETGSSSGLGQFVSHFSAAAEFLNFPSGPNCLELEFGGWDTHANQGMGSGSLDKRLEALANGMLAFKQILKPNIWNKTVVIVMTEFGRTARFNGNGGTDHGSGGTTFLFGGAVNGGTVLADWPGVADNQLGSGRELLSTIDTRTILKGVLSGHLDISKHRLDNYIFPNSSSATAISNLIV